MCFKYFLPVVIVSFEVGFADGYALEGKRCIDVVEQDFTWVNGCINNVMKINFREGVKYFRECEKKLDRYGTVRKILNDYFDQWLPRIIKKKKRIM